MANNHFLSTVYGRVLTIDNKNGGPQINPDYGLAGLQKSFPSAGTVFTPVSPGVVMGVSGGTVTINAIIEVLPTGTNHRFERWAVADTVATLNTNAT